MNSSRYKKLLTNLPSMAAVVNSFSSEQVQCEVFEVLIEALDEATSEELGESRIRTSLASRRAIKSAARGAALNGTAELMEGDSIHSIAAD